MEVSTEPLRTSLDNMARSVQAILGSKDSEPFSMVSDLVVPSRFATVAL